MTRITSPHGIVGLGALGRAMELFIAPAVFQAPPVILFTVKAFDLRQALVEQSDQWPATTPFVIMCNGYITTIIESLSSVLKDRPIRIGMTTIGSTMRPNGDVVIFSENTVTAWGPWTAKAVPPTKEELALINLFPNGQWYDDIRPMIRQKWVFNVVINSLTGFYQLKNNGLMRNHKSETEALFDEAYELAGKLWAGLPWDIGRDTLLAKLWSLVDATAGNENSMARDIRLHRRTETEFLAGIANHYDGFPLMKRLHAVLNLVPAD